MAPSAARPASTRAAPALRSVAVTGPPYKELQGKIQPLQIKVQKTCHLRNRVDIVTVRCMLQVTFQSTLRSQLLSHWMAQTSQRYYRNLKKSRKQGYLPVFLPRTTATFLLTLTVAPSFWSSFTTDASNPGRERRGLVSTQLNNAVRNSTIHAQQLNQFHPRSQEIVEGIMWPSFYRASSDSRRQSLPQCPLQHKSSTVS